MTDVDAAAAQRPDSRSATRSGLWIAGAGWAGITGPVLFTVIFLALETVRRDFDPVRLPVSALEAGRYGWVQQVSFAVFGVLTVVCAAGIHRGLRKTSRGIVGPILLGVSGVAALAAGVFPLRLDAAGQVYDPGGHTVAGITFFLTSALALVILSRRVAADPARRSLAGWTLAAGIACLVGFGVMGTLVIPDDAPLHDWAGLGQRAIVILALFPARVALSIRLLTIGRSGDLD
jgi:hypothetical membrane protein